MRISMSVGLACALSVGGLGTAAGQSATDQYITVSGSACRPTGPNSANFVSRAIGGRNESTTAGVFVICPLTVSPTPSNGGAINAIFVAPYSLDGAAHDITCTAVVGSLNRSIPPTYSSKVATVTGEANDTVAAWTAADFGGPAGAGIPGSAWTTVTCMLPPQTAIGLVYAKYRPETPPQ
jgi:hypothetical protein